MKNAFVRALSLGIALAFPTTVFAQAAAGGDAPAEKKEGKKMKKEKKAAGDEGAAPAEGEKPMKKKKSKASDAEKATP